MRDDITCVFEGVAGVGGIYISNLKAAQNKELLKSMFLPKNRISYKGYCYRCSKWQCQAR